MNKLDATHAPELNSWAAWANVADTDFCTSIHHARAVGKSSGPTTRCCPTTNGSSAASWKTATP